jgi:parallel beta-helix repeat protein
MGNSAYYGGGAYSNTLNNCTLTGNSATLIGGGACFGVLNNCTLTGNSSSYNGGGAYSNTLNRCTLTGNSAFGIGGGAYDATLNNCTLTGNSAGSGGGAYETMLNNCILYRNSASGTGGGASECTLNNCTLTGNLANTFGGGVYDGRVNNCIVYYDSAPVGADCYSTANYFCSTPLPANGAGNIIAEPQLASLSHLSATSPCIGAGNAAYATGLDLDGEPWASPPSIGCDEYWSGSVTGELSVAIVAAFTNVSVGFAVDFQALIGGRSSASQWDLGSGLVFSNRPYASHSWAAPGDYVVQLRAFNENYPTGVVSSVTVHVVGQPVLYVSLTSTNPVAPYGNWATAATNIQSAVDAAGIPGSLVLVSNGVYQTGATVVYGMSNRLAVTRPVTVQSVNGPAYTSIVGYRPNGASAIRCVSLTNGARLAGFTLTNGATQSSGHTYRNQSGGGVWCESGNALVTNCTLSGNVAYYYGGGAFGVTLNNCTLAGNSAHNEGGGAAGVALTNCTLSGNSAYYAGGAFSSTLNNCTLTGNSADYAGGGAWDCTLANCTLKGNSAQSYGGGAADCTLSNCTLTTNSAGVFGGGTQYGTLINCTLTGNSAQSYAGGAYYGTLNNCILYYNSAPTSSNHYFSVMYYSCTTPQPGGSGNITNEPRFLNTNGWSNLRLQSSSACINAGNNAYVAAGTDLDGNPRIVGGTADIGAYEFQSPQSVISYAWLQQYGMPTDGSADYLDTDHDGMNNWQEWVAGTSPTDSASVLRMALPVLAATNVTLTWTSVTNRTYTLQSATNLGAQPSFLVLQSNVAGSSGTTSWIDTNTPAAGPRFYRVRVEN